MDGPLQTPVPPPPPPPPPQDREIRGVYFDDGYDDEEYDAAKQQELPDAPRVVVLNQLEDQEKELYFQFLLENEVQFSRVEDDCYVANVRMVVAPREEEPQKTKAKPSKSKLMARKLAIGHSAEIYGRRASRPPQEMARVVNAIATSKSLFDFSCYPKFSSLVTMRDQLRPRRRHVAWLLKMIEEIYRDRYEHDTADLRNSKEGVENKHEDDGNVDRLSNIFPVFVVDFLSKRFGLRSLVDQHAWDLMYNMHALRKEYLEVEIFARFLEEYYDADDLLFFLYVHSVVEHELSVNFVNRWTSASRGKARMPDKLFLSIKQCQLVARVVFGDEHDPLYQAFMLMIMGQVKGTKTGRRDTRRIEVTQFLHLALVEYHETRPADDEEDIAAAEAAAADSNGLPGHGTVLVRSKEEQNRLFEEAVGQFEERMNQDQSSMSNAALHVEQDLNREIRVQEMEESILRAMEKRQAMSEGAGLSTEASSNGAAEGKTGNGMMDLNHLDAYLENVHRTRDITEEMMNQISTTIDSPGKTLQRNGSVPLDARRQLEQLAPCLAQNEATYVNGLMRACEGMKQAVAEEVKTAMEAVVRTHASEFMEKIIKEIETNPYLEPLLKVPETSAPMPFKVLVQAYKGLIEMENNPEKEQAMMAFAANMFKTIELRETIETNVIVLVNYARNTQEKYASESVNADAQPGPETVQ